MKRILLLLPSLVIPAFAPTLAHAEFTKEQLEWLNNDSAEAPITAHVNEGKLVFLAEPPDKPVHHHQNRITLSASSLRDGWVKLNQCHNNLDPVSRVQIVYSRHRTRNLTVESVENMDAARVEGHTVQLENVRPNARLCVSANSNALTRNSDGSYSLGNGPFMRRFLDGYYPMRVSVNVNMPRNLLRFDRVSPAAQQGFDVKHDADNVSINTWFEGKLKTVIRFMPIN